MAANVHTGPTQKPQGYHRLAALMTADKSIAIFRRFDALNILSLLSLQAEIVDLQGRLAYQCQLDEASQDADEKMYSRWFLKLQESARHDGDQHRMLKEMRSKLREYNDALLQVARLEGISEPASLQLDILQDWLRDPKGGNNFLKGAEARQWKHEADSSFVCLGPQRLETDPFTKLISSLLINVFHQLGCISRTSGKVIDLESGLTQYDEAKLNKASKIIVTILSSVLPVISIFVLYIVKNTYARIGITVGFTGCYAAILATFSSARRVEIFAATATFAAIEVVFIGTALPQSNG